jgi:hypothetical protein
LAFDAAHIVETFREEWDFNLIKIRLIIMENESGKLKKNNTSIVLIIISICFIVFFIGVHIFPVVPPNSIAAISSQCPGALALEQSYKSNPYLANLVNTIMPGIYDYPFFKLLGVTSLTDLCTKINAIIFLSYALLLTGIIGLVAGVCLTLKH